MKNVNIFMEALQGWAKLNDESKLNIVKWCLEEENTEDAKKQIVGVMEEFQIAIKNCNEMIEILGELENEKSRKN